jgi:thymidylate kinase
MNTYCHVTPDIDDVAAIRRTMFLDFCALLERSGIEYVILHGYLDYPDRIESDVDFQVSRADFERLPTLFASKNCIPGATLVQVLRHETGCCYYVFSRQIGSRVVYLHADAAADYRLNARLWLRSDIVVASRRKSPVGFWTPAPAVEFEYYFVKRIVDKALIEEDHARQLARNLADDRMGCMAVLNRFLPTELTESAEHAIRTGDIGWFSRKCDRLRRCLIRSTPQESVGERMFSWIDEGRRVACRVFRPTGLVVAVLGADGSGKTTVIEHLTRELAPAFRRVRRFHFRPWFGKQGGAVVSDPHGQPPRSWIGSFTKTTLYLIDYWLGWLRLVMPAKVRSTLVVFDRYYHDMLVDAKRYRLPPHFRPIRWLAFLVPQPDMWLVLDASAATLIERKAELDYDTASELAESYRELAMRLPHASLISTDKELELTLSDAVRAVRFVLEQRVLASPVGER